VYKRTERRD